MTAQVSIDSIPALARPGEVEQAISDARQLRDRAREAAEAVAAAQQAVDAAEREDVEAAAARARAGEPLGAQGRAVEKARDKLLLAQRDLNAVRMAQGQAEDDVAAAIVEHADRWTVDLAGEVERAREAGRASIAALQDATRVGSVMLRRQRTGSPRASTRGASIVLRVGSSPRALRRRRDASPRTARR